jgi:hypothetical protein
MLSSSNQPQLLPKVTAIGLPLSTQAKSSKINIAVFEINQGLLADELRRSDTNSSHAATRQKTDRQLITRNGQTSSQPNPHPAFTAAESLLPY